MTVRIETAISRLLLLALFAGAPMAVLAQATATFDLPVQPLAESLKAVGTQTNTNVLVAPELVDGKQAPALRASLTVDQAMAELLKGTGITYRFLSEKTVILAGEKDKKIGEVGTSNRDEWVRMAQAESGAPSAQGSPETGAAAGGGMQEMELEEIVVTAQKRVERLHEVPVPVTAINAQALATNNQLRLKDYYSKVPGLSLAQTGDTGQPIIAIRGLVTGGQTSGTVGYVVDDVPFGATLNPGTLPYAPEIDPSDLARIEVLRGPQGTLYGASSLGGLLKFVTVDPSTERFSGRVQAGTTSVEDGDDFGYSVRGSVNVPLSDTFAVRASGFMREDPGYVDNPQSGQEDVNNTEGSGGRLAALWRPSDVFSLKLSGLMQNVERNGRDDIDRSLGSNPQYRTLRGAGTYDRKAEAYSATMSVKLGRADLVSITGYNVDEIDIRDSQAFFISIADGSFDATLPPPFTTGVNTIPGASSINVVPIDTKKFTQELRATLPLGERVQWLIGGFYTDEDFNIGFDAFINDAVTGATLDTMLLVDQPVTFEEYAAFTNFTFDITDRFDVQVGGRFSENRQTFSSHREGQLAPFFYGSDPSDFGPFRSKDSSFTYLLTPRLKVSPDLMVYARLASGYRPGSSNANCHGTFSCQYDPDTTRNYDIGVKGSLLDNALSFDASVYYIDWKDIQIPSVELVPLTFLQFTQNVGAAKSQGVELSMQSRPLRGLSLSGWVAWSNAELKEALPAESGVQALAGARLPYSSPFSANFTIDHEFPLWGNATGLLGGSVSYVGERRGEFKGALATRGTFPSYSQVDLTAGLRYGTWNLNAFVNNVTDKRGILRDGPDFGNPDITTRIQPRTIGLQLEYQFD